MAAHSAEEFSLLIEHQKQKPKEGGPTFSFSNRLHRAAWNITWRLLATWTPPFLRPWRRVLLRLFGAKIASTANVYGSAHIWLPRNLQMDPYSCLGPKVTCYNMAMITIGRRATVSQGAHLCAGTHDVDDPDHRLQAKPIIIGENAWIAAEAFIGPGVRIGAWSVLGARSVAFRDLEPCTIYIGNPAVPARQRKIGTAADNSQ
ncbi:putative colanic acid biosynthesis acetyltransferase [Bradyrhizobium liaoningense]